MMKEPVLWSDSRPGKSSRGWGRAWLPISLATQPSKQHSRAGPGGGGAAPAQPRFPPPAPEAGGLGRRGLSAPRLPPPRREQQLRLQGAAADPHFFWKSPGWPGALDSPPHPTPPQCLPCPQAHVCAVPLSALSAGRSSRVPHLSLCLCLPGPETICPPIPAPAATLGTATPRPPQPRAAPWVPSVRTQALAPGGSGPAGG